GIRDLIVTGVQTCALPIFCYPWASSWSSRKIDIDEFPNAKRWLEEIGERPAVKKAMAMGPEFREAPGSISPEEQARRRKLVADRSEERRVGKECRDGEGPT